MRAFSYTLRTADGFKLSRLNRESNPTGNKFMLSSPSGKRFWFPSIAVAWDAVLLLRADPFVFGD